MIAKVLLLFLCFGGLSSIFYIYKLHSLAVEGNQIFEDRCLQVNPILIGYKNSFLKYANYLNNYPNVTETPEDVQQYIEGYLDGMKEYIPVETEWLNKQKAFINRWDYNLFEPWYFKKAGKYQIMMYEGYLEDAKTNLAVLDNPELQKSVEPGDISDARQKRDTYISQYYDFFEEASEISDWRKFFSRVPVPEGCTEENVIIPETGGSINWEGSTSTPSSVPLDLYSSS